MRIEIVYQKDQQALLDTINGAMLMLRELAGKMVKPDSYDGAYEHMVATDKILVCDPIYQELLRAKSNLQRKMIPGRVVVHE